MNFALRILFVMLCHAHVGSAALPSLIIMRFQPHINNSATILGDVLQIQHDARHWSTLSLQSHPLPGDVITKDKIITWLKDQVGDFNSTWQGKTQTHVEQTAQSTPEALIEKAHAALLKKLETSYTRVEVSPLSHPNAQKYAADQFKSNIVIAFPTPSRVCVWLIYKTQRIAIWFKVKAYAKVLVANQDMHERTLIKSEDYSWEEHNIAGLTSKPVFSIPKKAWLLSSLKKGQFLMATKIKTLPMVIKGETIKVSVQNHHVTVVMEAEALRDGYLGEAITVKNLLNQKVITAIVSDVQQAEIRS